MQHAVTLMKEKCKGCTTCIKQCPTEAIRVRRGRATIIDERCIDCGQCIRVCPHNAKKAVYDPLTRLADFQYTVALPAPSLYGQFHNLEDINQVLGGLLNIGFDHVYEVAKGAEMLSAITRHVLAEESFEAPLISSACPAVVRLIRTRFPKMVGNLARHIAPMELAAIHAREEAAERTGLLPEQIGIFFITPCPAKVTAIHAPGHLHHRVIDGAFSMAEVYKKLLSHMRREDVPDLLQSGMAGVGWAVSGGESSSLSLEQHLSVDGIEHVIQVLEEVEDGKLSHVQFLELGACNQGCVGGCLTVENPYVAKARIRQLMKGMPVSQNTLPPEHLQQERFLSDKLFEANSVWQLAEDRADALERYQKISALLAELPGLDCGSCGTPCCRALAEDVVQGFASEDDCIFRVRERMQSITASRNADDYLPPPFRKGAEKDE
ncbi:MAG: 4Fe-4S binding protein [Oscillospiraceae bacterium]|nr:4Fe-4S binding protein [Oscillospiraceae bacterium]